MTYSSDFNGLQMWKIKQQELVREAQREHQARELLRLQPVKRRLRLPKITISWN